MFRAIDLMELCQIARQKYDKILTKSSTNNVSQIQSQKGQSVLIFLFSYLVIHLYLTHFPL